MKTSAEIRSGFLDYFRRQGHTIVPSASLVPENDPTLLFTNAGMVPFKEVFLGRERRPYTRAASVQRCLRAGGKHNDLENVGYTARHHTFFEMLGNFSFGDYFKREAIAFAWELLTVEWGIDPARLWVTVYTDDDEAARIWLEEIGVDPARFSRCGEKSNFWTMGDTGPCGPSSEIFYDHGPEIPGGPPGSPDEDGDRYVEIWNLVFTQYDRDAAGRLHPLPRPSVDTGMGLERIAAVLQGVHSNYDTDLFVPLIEAVREMVGRADADRHALQVIADHARASSFLVTDGVLPANEGRGYVLRRIIRRAARHGYMIGLDEPFLHRLVAVVERIMGEAYPELVKARPRVEQVLREEEERFAQTLARGMQRFEQVVSGLGGTVIPGEAAFELYDTYGFPVDLTADMARERGLTVDQAGFERAMAAQRERARAASQFAAAGGAIPAEALAEAARRFHFTGYDTLTGPATVLGLFTAAGEPVERLEAGQEGLLLLDQTPFYAESGGQVGDRGQVTGPDGVFEVTDTRRQGGVHVHVGRVRLGAVARGQRVRAEVDAAHREPVRRHHSATHLLHAALRRVLGEHVEQRGSLVAPDRLRFDFTHPEPVSDEQLAEIERLVNVEVMRNVPVETELMSLEEARRAGAVALFGEKYGERVRVLRMGDFSMELCGGTHVARTGDIGLVKLLEETGVAAGVRRIEAVAGEPALEWVQGADRTLRELSAVLRVPASELAARARQLAARVRELERDNESLRSRLAAAASGGPRGAEDDVTEVGGVKVVARRVEGVGAGALRGAADTLKARLGPKAVVVLAAVDGGKVRIVASVSDELTDRIDAVALVNHVAAQVGGKGGGRRDFAQAGGSEPAKLDAALESVPRWVGEALG